MRKRTIRNILPCTLALGGMMAFIAGCPGTMPTQNSAPMANAGANQTVQQGATVTLNGSGSSDPDGDALSFSWSQTGGTNTVSLSDTGAAVTTFTAPNSDDVLTFSLSVSDGSLSSTATTTVTVSSQPPPPPATTPRIFIANFAGNNVTSYANPATVNGNIAPDTNLAGAQTQLINPSDIIVDAGGALSATNFGNLSITSYDNAENTNGNLAPNRNVQGAATLLANPTSMTVNTANDLAFVADISLDQILVFADASTPAFNGNLAPIRQIVSADLNNPFGINFGANDNLYVANNGNANVVVFANASNLNGNVNATRIITSVVFGGASLYDVFINNNDTMLVVDANGFIYTFNNASTLNGNVAPDFTLTVQPAMFITSVSVDSNGAGYITDTTNNAVYSYNNIGTLNGVLPPDRTIQGANTQLIGPIRTFLIE